MRRKERYRLPVTIMRGETSKGIYILESELPDNRDEWEPLLLRLMGSLDKKQIDGLGGSQPVTSKAAILYDRDFAIAGVLGTAAPIRLTFTKPAGTLGWGLLPTGNAVDILEVPGVGPVWVSIVDAANPLVFICAGNLGLRGGEQPAELERNPQKLDMLEKVRGMAAVRMGLIKDYIRSA